MYESIKEIIQAEEETGIPFWKLVMMDDCKERGTSEEDCFNRMLSMYTAMKESDLCYNPGLKSNSGLVGGEAEKFRNYSEEKETLCGDFLDNVIQKALKVAESNACMRRIVAAPTAGSCGVLPAVLISIQEKKGFSDEKMTEALFVAAGIGGVIANKASLAGAAGGCQAEIGSASSMAAGGLAYLLGTDSKGIQNAAALAMKNLLGLACDPVAGLVEIPCVKRNVCGAVNAVTSAELTMAGIESKIPADEVFEAMNSISKNMSETIKETAEGGLARTETGMRIAKAIL